MAANVFGRYVWLVDLLRRYKRLTFEEINAHWVKSGLSYGEEDELPLRTFHNHRQAIKDIFDVYIDCDMKNGYKYYIDQPERLENDSLRIWLLDSFATLNHIHADASLKDRIIYEDVPSGQIWLTTIMEAMRQGKILDLTYRAFGKKKEFTFDLEPYYLKIYNRRWYLIGKHPCYQQEKDEADRQGKTYDRPIFRVYALDRVLWINITDKSFKMDKSFEINSFYEGCCGITPSDISIEHIIIRAYGREADYLRSLPLHDSQEEIEAEDGNALFSFDIRPTFDFYLMLMSQGDQLEVLEPLSVREEMKKHIARLSDYYK